MDDELNTMGAAAHEALGRMVRDEPVGEADLANIVRFSHHFLAQLHKQGYYDPTSVPGTTVQLSFNAQSGPAHDPSLPRLQGIVMSSTKQ